MVSNGGITAIVVVSVVAFAFLWAFTPLGRYVCLAIFGPCVGRERRPNRRANMNSNANGPNVTQFQSNPPPRPTIPQSNMYYGNPGSTAVPPPVPPAAVPAYPSPPPANNNQAYDQREYENIPIAIPVAAGNSGPIIAESAPSIQEANSGDVAEWATRNHLDAQIVNALYSQGFTSIPSLQPLVSMQPVDLKARLHLVDMTTAVRLRGALQTFS